MSAYAPWNFSATAYTSVRLHVVSTTASRMFCLLVSPITALGSSAPGMDTRSSSSNGPVRWLTPITTMDMRAPPYALAVRCGPAPSVALTAVWTAPPARRCS